MKRAAFFIAGLAFGVYLAKQIDANPEAKKAVKDAGDKVRIFTNAVVAGYREQESKSVSKPKAKQ